MRTLVTGGAGFIGHHLVAGLLRAGHEVRVLDDYSTGRRDRLAAVEDAIALREGSVLDAVALDDVMGGVEVVFHQAAIPSVARSLTAPRLVNDVNANGTIEVMGAAARAGVRRVMLAASSSVYGVPDRLPCRESFATDPRSPYAVSKLAAEGHLHSLGRYHGIETVALRYFNVYGPGQDPASEYAAVVPRFSTAALEGRRPIVNGSGEISRDFTFVDDVVHANLLAATAPLDGPLTCNVGGGQRHTLADLLRAIGAALGRGVEADIGPARPGDVPHSHADISLAAEALGYAPLVSFEAGIARTVAWYAATRPGSPGGA